MAAVIAETLTNYTASPGDAALDGKCYSSVWWNPFQGRWDGVLPWEETAPDTANGKHYVVKNVLNPDWPTEDSQHLTEDRGAGRPTTWFEPSRRLAHVVSAHQTATEYWRYTYDVGADTYTLDVGASGAGESVPGITHETTGYPIGVGCTPNGKLWVGALTSAGFAVNVRTPGTGGSWGTAFTVDGTINAGVVAMGPRQDSSDELQAYFFCCENDTETPPEWKAFHVQQDADWTSGGNWTEHSWTKTDMDSTGADNHIDIAIHDGDIYLFVKTDSTDTGDALNGIWRCAPDGTYTAFPIRNYSATQSERRSRGAISIDIHGNMTLAWQREPSGTIQGWYLRSHVSDLVNWTAEADLFVNGTDSFWDIRSPQADFLCTPQSGTLFVAEHATDAGRPGDDMWAALLDVGPARTYYYR